MTDLLPINSAVADRLAEALLHSLWIGGLLVVVAIAVARLRVRSANGRYRTYWAALVGIILSLPASFCLVRYEPSALTAVPTNPVVQDGSRANSVIETNVEAVLTGERNASVDSSLDAVDTELHATFTAWIQSWRNHSSVITRFYFVGVCLMLLRLSIALWRGQRIRKRAESIESGLFAELAQRARTRMGLRVIPILAKSIDVHVPSVTGLWRPAILVPASVMTGLSTDLVEILIIHELAHLRRKDHWGIVAQHLIEAVAFYHPAIWLLSRLIRIEREHACDDLVVAVGVERSRYAKALVDMADLCRKSGSARPELQTVLGAISHQVSRLRYLVERLLGREGWSLHGVGGWPVAMVCSGTLVAAVTVSFGESNLATQNGSEEKTSVETPQFPVQVSAKQAPRGPFRDSIAVLQPTDTDTAKSLPGGVPNGTVQISHVDQTAEAVRSLAASGHAVRYQRPDKEKFVEAVQIFASRYGMPKAPKDDFHLYLLNEKFQVLADVRFPYAMIPRGEKQWHTLRTPSIEVPAEFYVALAFNPRRTKGIYLGLDENVTQTYSLTGIVRDGFKKWPNKSDWMLRVHLSELPTGELGEQKLADWKAPKSKSDPFAECLEARYDTGKSEGQQSYGGAGPVLTVNLNKLIPKDIDISKVKLKGLRVYGSRYGSGYNVETTMINVDILDANANVLRKEQVPYQHLTYKARWVDLELSRPVAIAKWVTDGKLTIGIDPQAHQRRGVYFHYQKPADGSDDSEVSKGFVPNKRFFKTKDRRWLIRAYFEME